jgi:hypothetical protein
VHALIRKIAEKSHFTPKKRVKVVSKFSHKKVKIWHQIFFIAWHVRKV